MPDIVLGIDPGLTRCGYGVIVKSSSRQVAFQRVGVFESSSKDELSVRIEKILSRRHAGMRWFTDCP